MHVYIIFIDSPGKGLWVIAEFLTTLMNSERHSSLALSRRKSTGGDSELPLNLEKPEVLYRWHTDSVELRL